MPTAFIGFTLNAGSLSQINLSEANNSAPSGIIGGTQNLYPRKANYVGPCMPPKGPLSLSARIQLNNVDDLVEIDLSYVIGNGTLDFVTGVYLNKPFDLNESTQIVLTTNNGQQVYIPSGTQGAFPLIAENPAKITFAYESVDGGVRSPQIFDLVFVNYPFEPYSVSVRSGLSVSGNWLTDAQLRASPVTVDGEIAISGNVPVTGPLTDTELRASPVPVSGPLTDAQLRASPIPVSANASQFNILDGTQALTGNPSQVIAQAGDAGNYFFIYNPAGNDPVILNLAGTATTASGFPLAPDTYFELTKGCANQITVEGTAGNIVVVYTSG